MNPLIRPETSADHEANGHVNRLAFGQDAEARLYPLRFEAWW